MSKYLFIRESDGAPVYGDTKFHVKQPGQYAPDPSDDLTRLTIIDRMNRNETVDLSKPISFFLKEDGSPYDNYAELDAAMAGFFFRVANGSGFGTIRITGNGSTDYAAPSDLKVGSAIFALNPADVEVSSLTVSDIATIRFTVAPEVGDFPLVIYTKK